MGFASAVRACLAKYASIDGRATRAEFWWFFLFQLLLMLVMGLLAAAAATWEPRAATVVGTAWGLAYLLVVPPMIAVTIRRLHDRNRSGWSYFWVLVPFVGGLIVLIWCAQRGVEGLNRFGLDPTEPDGSFRK